MGSGGECEGNARDKKRGGGGGVWEETRCLYILLRTECALSYQCGRRRHPWYDQAWPFIPGRLHVSVASAAYLHPLLVPPIASLWSIPFYFLIYPRPRVLIHTFIRPSLPCSALGTNRPHCSSIHSTLTSISQMPDLISQPPDYSPERYGQRTANLV